MEDADFSGYATKAGLKCSDGRTITAQAFQHMDKVTVPLVWQHGHNTPENVLGHAVLEAREDGVYAYGFFNDTPAGQNAKKLVQHKDIDKLSIFANQLVEKAKSVLHGMIREVSLVLAGANPGAIIDYVRVVHADGETEVLDDEAVIYTGLTLEHADRVYSSKTTINRVETMDGQVVRTETSTSENTNTVADKPPLDVAYSDLIHAKGDKGKTVEQVYESLSDEQRDLLHYMIGEALKAQTAKHSDDDTSGELNHEEGTTEMTRNVFEKDAAKGTKDGKDQHVLTHDAIKGIVADAVEHGSLKKAVEAYALQHGIEDIDVLFPEAKTLNNTPEWNKRRTEWVAGVLNSVRKSPFSRVKSIVADLTQDAARAKGYIKGNYKKEEWFGLTSRVTTPTTVYKKQKLDRDDVIDITDFDVVAWIKGEMRLMLEEELARAILIGDGRDPGDEDKVKDPGSAAEGAGIRAIVNENELYATTVYVNIDDTNSSYLEVMDEVLRARKFYKGTGQPTFYTTADVVTSMLLLRDETGSNRRLYNTVQELANALRVRDIVEVEVMEDEASDVVGIIVNLADYNVGADRGGEVNMFEDFDIDYNQQKYLIETRISGALTKIKSALVIRKTASANVLATPTEPAFNASTGVVTIPTVTGVVYKDGTAAGATLVAGAQTALDPGEDWHIVAVPASGYYFSSNAEDEWDFTRNPA